MSLKALVQLFAEKFLVSKKEWVAEQSTPSSSYVLVTPQTTNGGYGTLAIAPFNGFCTLRQYEWSTNASNSFGCIENKTNTVGMGSVVNLNNTFGRLYCIIPVKKGDKIEGRIIQGATYELSFIKTSGQT